MINTVSITDLKQNMASVIKKVREEGESVVVIQHSEVAAVLVEPNHYGVMEEALEKLEEFRDLQSLEDTKDEPTISLDEYYNKRFGKKYKEIKNR